jgi:2'-5' RNA ligase
MSLAAHYDAMRTAAVHKLARGEEELDPWLDAPQDTRRGLTLLSRPTAHVATAIAAVLADFQCLDPAQYYYPATDLHLTILSLISCYEGFALEAIDPAAYRALVGEVLRHTRPFAIRLAGLTASTGGLLVQGFPLDEGLATLRANLRTAFRVSGLRQSIDQRYSIQTAHLTIARFRQSIGQPRALLALLAAHAHTPLGTLEVNCPELVFNDWYQRAAHTQVLATYPLSA